MFSLGNDMRLAAPLMRAQPLVFETHLELPIAELPALHQISDMECPTESVNGASCLHYSYSLIGWVRRVRINCVCARDRAAASDQANLPAECAAP